MSHPEEKEDSQHLMRALEASRAALKSERERLLKVALNTFSVLGEACVNEEGGVTFNFLGDTAAEAKLGLPPGSIPRTLLDLLAKMHPDDLPAYRQAVEHAKATGAEFNARYRISDGKGGWRHLQSRAISVEERNGIHVRWLSNIVDITEQQRTEEELRQALKELRALKEKLQSENLYLQEEVERKDVHRDIIGNSAVLKRVIEQVELVAGTSSTVLISGETGTGKELVARAIHRRSRRQKQLFVAVNCAALPASLVESELFGHERGAFTGAIAHHTGRFEQADGGTLFLDEVGEMPLETQPKLLRVLQSGEFERVGGERPLKCNVRVIAASNRHLEQAVRDGQFRADLYHRLSVFPIHLPPLRERREDIPLLAAYLVTRKARQLGRSIERISHAALHRLITYDWPGNVRELENVLERAIILSTGSSIQPQSVQLGTVPLHHAHKDDHHTFATAGTEDGDTLQARERAHILRICQTTGWKIKGPAGAAVRLGLKPGTLYSRMKKLAIQRPPPR